MKKNLFSLLFCLAVCQGSLLAQNETKTLFGDSGLVNTNNLGFFVTPSYGFTQMDGSNATLLNLRSGISIKDKFTFGGYFNISHNESRPQSEIIPNAYLEYWTVGGFAEYTLLSKKVIHLTFPLYVGYGEVQMYNENGIAGLGKENLLQIEPSAFLEINLFKNTRLNVGAGYRFVGEMDYRNLNQSDISGLTAYFGLKLGLFR